MAEIVERKLVCGCCDRMFAIAGSRERVEAVAGLFLCVGCDDDPGPHAYVEERDLGAGRDGDEGLR